MEKSHKGSFKVGDWLVEPERDRISRESVATTLRPQVMELLVYLAGRSGQVVGADELLNELWRGKVVTSSSIYNSIAELRQALAAAEDRRLYIETVPKRGYRLVAPVTSPEQHKADGDRVTREAAAPRRKAVLWLTAGLAVALAVAFFGIDRHVRQQPPDATPSIAVMPFTDLSPEGNQAYFADGISEELLNALAQLPELRVISHSSSFALRGAGLSSSQVADRLHVDYVLEGSVRKAGDRLRITAQLIDARSDVHLSSQTYDRSLGDIFAIQQEIAAQVVDELKIRVLHPARAADVTDPEAYELFLQGRFQVSLRKPENLRQAAELFEQAISIDPHYAPAHAGLGKSLLLQAGTNNVDTTATIPRAAAALERALELDPASSDALATKGLMLLDWDSNREAARELLEQALASNPNNSDASRWLGLHYSESDPARYLALMRRAYLVDPLVEGANFHRIVALTRFARYGEALAAAREWYELNPAFAGPYAMAGRIHFCAGRPDKALASYYRAYRSEQGSDVLVYHLAALLANLNELELAEAWLRELQQDNADSIEEDAYTVRRQIVLAELRGPGASALRALTDIDERHPTWWPELVRLHVLVSGDFQEAREAWERGLVEHPQDIPRIWGGYRVIHYALALQRSGAAERAEALISESLDQIETQLAAGVVHYPQWTAPQASLRFYAATLHAMRGDAQQSLVELRHDALRGVVSCMICLRRWPHFDRVRDNPDFAALLADQEARIADERKQLADGGLLLTPEAVLLRDDRDFDPFAEVAQE